MAEPVLEVAALESINELEIRELLQNKLSPQELAGKVVRRLMDSSLSWEEKRPFWHFLNNTGRTALLAATLDDCRNALVAHVDDVLAALEAPRE